MIYRTAEADASDQVLSKISGRIIRPAEDISTAQAWLDDCMANHSECRVKRLPAAGGGEIEQKPFFPTRLIDVGPKDGSQEPFLEESEHRRGAYLTLSISASISTSGTSGAFYPRTTINMVAVPLINNPGGGTGSFVSDRILSTFEEDVLTGSLSARGWCLQERILPRRILHFGRDQSHWECSAGILSENSSERRTRAQFTAKDDAGDMRQRLASDGPLWEPSSHAVTSREPHGSWYRMVETYTKRQLTEGTDKLPALSGVARRFAAAICNDAYISGLWANDLPAGLMWSATGFLTPYGTQGHLLPRPAQPRAAPRSPARPPGAGPASMAPSTTPARLSTTSTSRRLPSTTTPSARTPSAPSTSACSRSRAMCVRWIPCLVSARRMLSRWRRPRAVSHRLTSFALTMTTRRQRRWCRSCACWWRRVRRAGPRSGMDCCCIISRRRARLGGLGWRRCGRGILCGSRRLGLRLFEGKGWF